MSLLFFPMNTKKKVLKIGNGATISVKDHYLRPPPQCVVAAAAAAGGTVIIIRHRNLRTSAKRTSNAV